MRPGTVTPVEIPGKKVHSNCPVTQAFPFRAGEQVLPGNPENETPEKVNHGAVMLIKALIHCADAVQHGGKPGQIFLREKRTGVPVRSRCPKNANQRTRIPQPAFCQAFCAMGSQKVERMIARLEEIFEEMLKNENFREKRRDTAQVLKMTGKCVDESVSVYLRWKNEEGDAVRTHQELEEQHQELGKCRQELEEYRQKLKSIREMRSWKLVEKYCQFMDHTVPGRLLGRIRDTLRR